MTNQTNAAHPSIDPTVFNGNYLENNEMYAKSFQYIDEIVSHSVKYNVYKKLLCSDINKYNELKKTRYIISLNKNFLEARKLLCSLSKFLNEINKGSNLDKETINFITSIDVTRVYLEGIIRKHFLGKPIEAWIQHEEDSLNNIFSSIIE